ncbi:MAG: hypothetical protein HY774_09070 [Acidobacteria bacterium]|nr:hypothetical protein [Acidobacteriota bacterium]
MPGKSTTVNPRLHVSYQVYGPNTQPREPQHRDHAQELFFAAKHLSAIFGLMRMCGRDGFCCIDPTDLQLMVENLGEMGQGIAESMFELIDKLEEQARVKQ